MLKKVLLLLAIGCSCAQPPKKEVDMTSLRVARAQDEGASAYAREIHGEAEEALARARDALSNPKRYREAVLAASLACSRADEARAIAIKEKERTARQTHRCLRECEALMEEGRSVGLLNPPPPELVSFSQRLAEIEALLEDGNVAEAYEAAENLKQALLKWLKKLERKQQP